MSSYISSDANRFYTALESAYGQVGQITAANRIPAVKLGVKQQRETKERRDKTGSRTYGGTPNGGRRGTTFDLTAARWAARRWISGAGRLGRDRWGRRWRSRRRTV